MEFLDAFRRHAPATIAEAVAAQLRHWDAAHNTRRLWDGDAALWTGGDEPRWLGWLRAAETARAGLPALHSLQADVRRAGYSDALLLGMGGSSLCPEVLAETFGPQAGYPRLHVLDSTDPAQVQRFASSVDLQRTLFIVASKSGTTLEPSIFKAYFFDRARQLGGAPGARFIAITDPGSRLEAEARADGFRAVFYGEKNIGGRFSALSNFGLVPAAVMGIDVERWCAAAADMVRACGPEIAAAENPGVALGVALGTCALLGRDKLTLVTSPGIDDLGAWLEQLIAESTGKHGKAIIPVDRESLAPPAAYGTDRCFVYVRLTTSPDARQDAAVDALEAAGQPVIRLAVADLLAIAGEFFRWEIATAVAGALLGIHPFDQPDVEASKVETRALTEEYERTGALPAEAAWAQADGMQIFADAANGAALARTAGTRSLPEVLRAHLARLTDGDYFALLAYVHMCPAHEAVLQTLRHRVRDRYRVATCLGFGPRFLHSTGQAYKGGPDSGVFLQITCDDAHDLPVPGHRYTFGAVKAAQARGDLQVLFARGRRALRVHLGKDVEAGLRALDAAVETALRPTGSSA